MIVLLAIMFVLFAELDSSADIYKYTSDNGAVYFTNTPMEGNVFVVIKEKEKISPQKVNKKSDNVRADFYSMAEEKAKEHNIDPQLVRAVIKAESNWNPNAISPKGAQGLMQLMPSTASIMGVSNPFNPEANIDGGVRYLKYLLQKFNGNLTLALAAYNAGPKLVEKLKSVPSIPETIMYVRRVMNYYSKGNEAIGNNSILEVKRENKIKKVILKDGTMLFTNSRFTTLYED